ncbi:MAG: metallophosphoesterase, partial [Lachnospiraceae bacterium]|nr:metallophosphoesterase [Lachnospiraceae bacterium]
MLKIIHCADLHLDSGMETRLSPDQAALRRSELLASFLRLVEYAAEEQVAAILLCGDLFDRERV